jgi:hypothetical protein
MQVVPLTPRRLEEGHLGHLDLLIGGLGWELRSRRVPEALRDQTTRVLLLDLDSAGQGDYDSNVAYAEDQGIDHPDIEPKQLTGWLVDRVSEIENADSEAPKVAIDVSSLSRDRIAYLIQGIQRLEERPAEDAKPSAIVDFLYTPAIPPKNTPGPEHIEILGPVTPRFAGFVAEPNSPVIAFVGLGIEEDRAIGALEYIEPAQVAVFVPYGEDAEFDEKVRDANTLIWNQVMPEKDTIRYRVDDPFWLYTTLEERVFNASAEGRPILVPLGPKIFAACCLLVASQHRRAGVWRVSPGNYGSGETVDSAGKLVGLRIEVGTTGAFGPSAGARAGSHAR